MALRGHLFRLLNKESLQRTSLERHSLTSLSNPCYKNNVSGSFFSSSNSFSTTTAAASLSSPFSSSSFFRKSPSGIISSCSTTFNLIRQFTTLISKDAFVGRVEPLNSPTIYTPPPKLDEKLLTLLTPEARTEISSKLEKVPSSFAVFGLSGKQYKVSQGDVIHTDRLVGVEPGEKIYLDKVLLVGTKENTWLGTPLLPQARVVATVEQQTKAEKIIVFKKKRRKNYRRTNGFRAMITVLRIEDILFAPNVYPDAPTFLHHHPSASPFASSQASTSSSTTSSAPSQTTSKKGGAIDNVDSLKEKLEKFNHWVAAGRQHVRGIQEKKRRIRAGMDPKTSVSQHPEKRIPYKKRLLLAQQAKQETQQQEEEQHEGTEHQQEDQKPKRK